MMSRSTVASVVIALALFVGCKGSDQSSKTETPFTSLDARFAQGKEAYDKKDWTEAMRIFEEIRIQSPTSEVAAEATYLEGMARFEQELYSGAAVDFRTMRRQYPSHPLAGRAQYMVGASYDKLSPRVELDQTYTIYAINEYQSFLSQFPTAPQSLQDSAQHRIADLRSKLAEKYYLSAELYIKIQEWKSALVYYDRILDQFYDTPFAPEAQLRIAEVSYDHKKVDQARDALTKFESKYLQAATEPMRQRALQLKSKL